MRDIRINASAIDALAKTPAGKTKTFLWDREVPGFGVYKNSRGKAIFVYQYRMPGSTARRHTIGAYGELTIAQARDLARTDAYKRRQGVDPIEERRQRLLEEQASEELILLNYFLGYVDRRAAASKPVQDYALAVFEKDILPNIGDQRIDRLDPRKLEALMKELGKRSTTARRSFIIYTKMLLNDAKRRGKVGITPMDEVETPSSGQRDRVLDQRETRIFCEASHDLGGPRGDAYECLLRLMRRHNEVVEMVWSEVDQATWTWSLPAERTKTKVAQIIHLPSQVKAILQRRQPDISKRAGLVFASESGRACIQGYEDRAALNAHIHRRNELDVAARGLPKTKIAHFTIHDLRTTGATWMQRKPLSVPPHVIEAVLNHSPGGKVKKTYQRHMYVEEVAEALQRWGDHIDGLLASPDAWPSGVALPDMPGDEMEERHSALTVGWPKRKRD